MGVKKENDSGKRIRSKFFYEGKEYKKNNNLDSWPAEIIYDNGDVFMGKFNGDVRDGFGILFERNGDEYSGIWRGNILKGTFEQNSLNIPNNEHSIDGKDKIRAQGEFTIDEEGNVSQNKYGILELRDSTKYRGELKDSIYHGNGYILFPDKSFYKGRFEDGVYEGHGECY